MALELEFNGNLFF